MRRAAANLRMKLTLFQDSRVGARRYNQDRVGHWSAPGAMLMLVADGMGGHKHGEIAAQLTLEFIAGSFLRDAQPRLANPDLFLFRAVGGAHAAVLQQAAKMRLSETPRTTVVACVVQDGHVWWSHVGDSRLYLVRDGRILARSRDHTRVQQLVDEGRIREEAISSHPDRNKVLQCIGGLEPPKLEPTRSERLSRNDIVLLCSDGFWGPITQRQLLTGLIGREIRPALTELIALAESRAGPQCDNVSVVAFAWGEDAVPEPDSGRTISGNDLPTDVQDFTATDTDFQKMTDEDVERAIDEIRAALKRNQTQR